MQLLNPKNPIPLHIQLRNEIEEKIAQGTYKEKIPSEREFMDEYSISRSTVREAISQLVNDGLVEKRHGKETFILNKPIQAWLGNLLSTTEIITNMGMQSKIELLEHGIVESSSEVKNALGSDKAYLIKRLRLANNIPIAIETQFYPIQIGVELESYDLQNGTIYDILENDLKIKLYEADELITSEKISKKDSELLKLDNNQNALYLERRVYDEMGHIIEFCKTSYNPTMYSIQFKSKRTKK